jgi:hypothetical protein
MLSLSETRGLNSISVYGWRGIGEERLPGWNVRAGGFLFDLGFELKEKKIKNKIHHGLLRRPPVIISAQQPTKYMVA